MSARRFDALTALLARRAASHPLRVLRLAALLGATRNLVTRRWPSVEEVATLFPSTGRRTAMAIGALSERNEVFVRAVRRSGLDAFRPLVSIPNAMRELDGPCILGAFHIGALHATGMALEQMEHAVLGFREGDFVPLRPPAEVRRVGVDEQQRARSFHAALERLRAGGIVLLALDVAPGAAIPTQCLGRNLQLARGAFALARLARAPIVPFAMRWTARGAEAHLGTPLAAESEAELAQKAASWLEAYLRARPAEIMLGLLRDLLYRETT